MYKKILLSVWFSFLLLAIPSISFWQTEEESICPSCTNSPKNVSLINDFTMEMLSTIRTIGTESPYAGKPVPPSRFNSWKFSPPAQWVMSKTLKRARESVNSVLSLTRIYTPLRLRNGMMDVGTESLVLIKNRTTQRDRKKVNQIEKLINKKQYELSVGWWRSEMVQWAALTRMQSIIKTYTAKWILDWFNNNSHIDNNTEYNEVLKVLWSINTSLKSLIATDNAKWINQQFNQWKFYIKFQNVATNSIINDYKCAKQGACNSSFQDLKKSWKEFTKSFKEGGTAFMKEFKDANQKLRTARSKWTAAKTKKTNWYDFIDFNPNYWQIDQTIQTAKNMVQLPSKLRRSVNLKKKEKQEDIISQNNKKNTTPSNNTNSSNNTNQTSTITSNSSASRYTTIMNKLTNAMNDVQSEATTANESAQLATVNDISIYFVALSERLTYLTKHIVGSKDQQNTLIQNFWELCSKQCTNISNKKCYY